MKAKHLLVVLMMVFSVIKNSSAQGNNAQLAGAWQIKEADKEHVLIFQDGFFFQTTYNRHLKQFVYSRGGVYSLNSEGIKTKVYFSSANKEEVGRELNAKFSVSGTTLDLSMNGSLSNWKRLDDGSAPLAGTWKITSRLQDGKLSPIHQTGARQTYKILSGTRFQWAAINPETKEFSGTGGGTYTFSNGKYTENIEFFSRDSSRVGASLTFDGKLENGEWHHSGLSSKGVKIHEIWSRAK